MSADPKLVAAVTDEWASLLWPHINLSGVAAEKLAEVALAAAARGIAERLRGLAAQVQVAIEASPDGSRDRQRWIVMEKTYRTAADLVLAWCSTEPGGDGG